MGIDIKICGLIYQHDLCLYTKPAYYLALRELCLLLLFNIRWKTISVDFVVELLESMVFDIMIIVIDSVSKRTHFISIHITITVESTTKLFLYNVWKLHSIPTLPRNYTIFWRLKLHFLQLSY